VSVVVPTRDRHASLATLLGSLHAQDLPPGSFETIVVDDGSTPPVESALAPGRPVVVRLEGRERSAARNAGAHAARGELLVFLDDDLTVGADFVSAHVRAQTEWPGVLSVGRIELPTAGGASSWTRFRQRLEDSGIPRHRGLVAAANFCTAGNMAIARDRFLGLGGFAEDLVSAEDQDLALRHSAAGGRIAFVPEAVAVHHDSAVDFRGYCRRVAWGAEHMVRFGQKHPGWPDNRERARINGPTRWREDPPALTARKVIKRLLSSRPLLAVSLAAVGALQRVSDGRLLAAAYRTVMGLHIFRGYRKGLARYGSVAPEHGGDGDA
jgi:GT2 family glycosyltransferase